MRKTTILFLLPLFILQTIDTAAQKNPADSLKQLLQNEKKDTNRVHLLNEISKYYLQNTPDSALEFARQGLGLAIKIDFGKGEAMSLNRIGNAFMYKGNYPKALQFHLASLKKAEAINDERMMVIAMNNTGSDYAYLDNHRQAVYYTEKALAIARKLDIKSSIISNLINLGDSYEKLNILDSARMFTNQAYDMAVQLKDDNRIGVALLNLASIHSGMGQDVVAMGNFNLCIPYLLQENNEDALSTAYLAMAKLFRKAGKVDSSLHYAKLSLALAKRGGFTASVMRGSDFLTEYYISTHNVDSAFVYQRAAIAAKDNLFSQEKQREIENLTFDETMRQQKIEAEKSAALEQRKHNIQYAAIAIGVLTFLIIFLVYSRTIVAHEKAIKFLGILALLLVFELINLLIHPYIMVVTHGSPVLQLLIAVAIAAMLIPVHHRLQHLINHKMVIKNKQLRLAAAERTVAKLKADTDLG